jgi:hypothetical protein
VNTYHKPDRDHIVRLDSPEAYAEWFETNNVRETHHTKGNSWGGDSYNSNINKLRVGDETLVSEAEKIIDKMQEQEVFTVGTPIMQSSIVGSIVNVPAAIMNHPKSMFRRVISETSNLNAPLTIYIEVVVSAGVSHKELMNRGIAVLAFCMAMQAIRPIEVYTVNCGGTNQSGCAGTIVKIASQPLDLARAAWMLTNPGYARSLAFASIQHVHSFTGAWAWNHYPDGPNGKYVQSMREMLGMNPEDIFMNGAFLGDELCLKDPVAWVQMMIKKHTDQTTLEHGDL